MSSARETQRAGRLLWLVLGPVPRTLVRQGTIPPVLHQAAALGYPLAELWRVLAECAARDNR